MLSIHVNVQWADSSSDDDYQFSKHVVQKTTKRFAKQHRPVTSHTEFQLVQLEQTYEFKLFHGAESFLGN